MSWNEVSRRYVSNEPEFYTPYCWRKRPDDGIKQGSSDECVENVSLFDSFYEKTDVVVRDVYKLSLDTYETLIRSGVAPEMARIVLPQSMLTEWIWTGSLYGFFNVWKQRADSHAQLEAQYFATLIDRNIPSDLKVSWEALKEYRP